MAEIPEKNSSRDKKKKRWRAEKKCLSSAWWDAGGSRSGVSVAATNLPPGGGPPTALSAMTRGAQGRAKRDRWRTTHFFSSSLLLSAFDRHQALINERENDWADIERRKYCAYQNPPDFKGDNKRPSRSSISVTQKPQNGSWLNLIYWWRTVDLWFCFFFCSCAILSARWLQ